MKFIKRLYFILRPFWKQGIFIGGLVFIQSILFLPTPFLSKYIIDVIIPDEKVVILFFCIGGLFALQVVLGRYGIWFAKYHTKFNQKLSNFIKYFLVEKLERIKFSFFRSHDSGGIINRFLQDINNCQTILFENVINIFIAISQLIFGMISIFYLSVPLSLVTLITIPFYVYVTKYYSPIMRKEREHVLKRNDDYLGVLKEFLSSIYLIKLYNFKNFEKTHFKPKVEALSDQIVHSTVVAERANFWISLFAELSPLLILGYGGYLIILGEFTLGSFFAFSALTGYVIEPINQIFSVPMTIAQVTPSLERIFEIVDYDEEQNNGKDYYKGDGTIEFQNVILEIDGQRIIDNMSFIIPSKSMIAFVGGSGAGKSTIIKLIEGVHKPTSGKILIDGQDSTEINISQLRDNINIVMQESMIVQGTIRENITLGKKMDETYIWKLLEVIKLKDVIDALPKKLDTIISSEYEELSGGQKQRLAIARSFAHKSDPSFVIFDEATSALDPDTEHKIQDTVNMLKGQFTLITVAHHLECIKNSDIIFVLEKGRLVEQGTFGILSEQNGEFRSIFNL